MYVLGIKRGMISPGRQPPLPAEHLSVFQACSFFNTWKFFNFLIYRNQRFLEITDCDLYFYLGNHLFINYECYLLVKNIQLWAYFTAWKKLTMNSFHFYVFFPLYDIFLSQRKFLFWIVCLWLLCIRLYQFFATKFAFSCVPFFLVNCCHEGFTSDLTYLGSDFLL